jgi:hypothetical protein
MPWPQHSPRWGFFSGPGALDAVRADFEHFGGFSGSGKFAAFSGRLPLLAEPAHNPGIRSPAIAAAMTDPQNENC